MRNILLATTVILLLTVWSPPVLGASSYDMLPEEERDGLFHDYLMEEVYRLSDLRKAEIESLLDLPEALEAKQVELRETYLMLLGDFPEKCPLNPVTTGTIEAEGYRIETVAFESRPNHHVTTNFYVPTDSNGPFPGVIVLCGHYPVGKAIGLYQDLCILFATNGIAALIVDPICQGERNQIIDADTGDLTFAGESGTAAHSRLDVGAVMNGTSVTAHCLWDNHRALDYLCSRTDVVDPCLIGCTGSSGGGSQATYLTAFDQRIKVSAVNSFIMNEPTLYSTIGPQTASQNLSYEGFYGIDHPSYITLFAPKPFMILAATQDFFDVTATRETYSEMQDIYQSLGEPNNIGYFEYNDSHGYSEPKREAAVQWFHSWFYDGCPPVTEPEHSGRSVRSIVEPDYTEQSTADLFVTATGQVTTGFENEKTVTDLNVELALANAEARTTFWSENNTDVCLDKVRQLLRLTDYETPVAEQVGTLERDTCTIEKLKILSGTDVPVTGLLFIPKSVTGKLPAVVYVDGRGKKTDAAAGGDIETLCVQSEKIVLAIDVRGFGETADNSSENESKHGNNEHRNAVISAYVGKTLVGQRVEDIGKTLDILLARDDVDSEQISLVGIDRAASAILHAAALMTTFKEMVLPDTMEESLIDIVSDPLALNNMTHVVPGALSYYDYPDLINAIAPRTVTYSKATGDSRGR